MLENEFLGNGLLERIDKKRPDPILNLRDNPMKSSIKRASVRSHQGRRQSSSIVFNTAFNSESGREDFLVPKHCRRKSASFKICQRPVFQIGTGSLEAWETS